MRMIGFFLRIEVAHACRSSDDTSRRLRSALEDRAREGRPHSSGQRPYWYAPDAVTILEDEAVITREIFARYLEGASPGQIAQGLTARGEVTVSGVPWQPYAVRAVLASRHVTGIRVFRGEEVGEGDWPAIIDRGTWREVQQPGRRTHPRRHLSDMLGETLPWTVLGAAPPAPLVPLQQHRTATAGQVVRPSQHPLLTRARHHPTPRAARRVRISGDQLHDPDPALGERDTLHRQPVQSQQTRRIIATVNHGPWLSSHCSRTQRGSRSHGPPSFRRAGPRCPIKIGEPAKPGHLA